jgi:hypothetical protein
MQIRSIILHLQTLPLLERDTGLGKVCSVFVGSLLEMNSDASVTSLRSQIETFFRGVRLKTRGCPLVHDWLPDRMEQPERA